jgi:hypothetical protein
MSSKSAAKVDIIFGLCKFIFLQNFRIFRIHIFGSVNCENCVNFVKCIPDCFVLRNEALWAKKCCYHCR